MSYLDVQRRMTVAFINEDPVTLVLTRHLKVPTSSGGLKRGESVPLPPKVFKLIEPSANPRPNFTVDGVVRTAEFVLLGTHDANIAVGDTFDHQGRSWQLVELFYDNGWERRATVVARG